MAEAVLDNISRAEALELVGSRDENIRTLRDALGVQVVARGGIISLRGTDDQVDRGMKALDWMRSQVRSRRRLSPRDIRSHLQAKDGTMELPETLSAPHPMPVAGAATFAGTGGKRPLHARSPGQGRYMQAIREHELTMCFGPAGTGKTYMAVGAALEALHERRIKRIVLVRPLVEAGEKLGYLPGDMLAKVHPFLRPLLDALRDMLDFHQVRAYLENDIVEIVPLAYMRGRTLNESFIILDEAQNTTIPQMKMFLTRLGEGSKIVVTGDLTQMDLPRGTPNGFEDAIHRLGAIKEIAIVRMATSDIVRHRLVEAIVHAYDGPEGADGPGFGASRNERNSS